MAEAHRVTDAMLAGLPQYERGRPASGYTLR